MRRESAFLLAILLIALTAKLSPAAVRYNLINLGVLEGYPQPEPVSINEQGRIVGLSFDVSAIVTGRATLFDHTGNGNNIDLGTVGGQESLAASINNHNQIIGFAENSEDPPVWYLTVFDINGSGNNIPIFRGAFGRCINDNAIIAGHVYITVDQKRVESAAMFNINCPNSFTELGTLSDFDSSQAYSINNHGQTVGIAYKSESQNYFETRAVYFHPTDPNNNTDLGALPGYDSATPFSINDSGKIVGRVHHSDHLYFTPRAVLFDPTGSENNIDLGGIPGSECAEAFSINNYDQIVGRALIGENMSDCAVMFDPTGQGRNINLNDRVESGDDLYLEAALAISNHGWITGIATDPNGKRVAFLLVPLPASKADFEPDGDIDLEDFGVLANAWRSTTVDDNWNSFCDISEPKDDVIDERDLAVLADDYLKETP